MDECWRDVTQWNNISFAFMDPLICESNEGTGNYPCTCHCNDFVASPREGICESNEWMGKCPCTYHYYDIVVSSREESRSRHPGVCYCDCLVGMVPHWFSQVLEDWVPQDEYRYSIGNPNIYGRIYTSRSYHCGPGIRGRFQYKDAVLPQSHQCRDSHYIDDIDGLVRERCNSIANAL